MLLRLSAALLALSTVVLAQTAAIPAPDDPVVYSSFFRLHNNAIATMAQQSAVNPALAQTLVNNLTASWYVKATDYPTILAITQEVIAKNGALSATRSAYLQQMTALNATPLPDALAQFDVRQQQIVMLGVNRLQAELPRISWANLHAFINWDHRKSGQVSPLPFQ